MRESLIDLLITLAAGGTLFGVPILLIAVLLSHRRQLRLLREFEYPATDDMLKRAKEARKATVEIHFRRLKSVDSVSTKILAEINLRIAVLNKARVRILRARATQYENMAELFDTNPREAGNFLIITLAENNLRILEGVEQVIRDLSSVDEETKRMLSKKR